MTMLEVNDLLLRMSDYRENTAGDGTDFTSLKRQSVVIESAIPEFTVEYIEEKQSYCLVPRRSLPKAVR